MQGFVAGDGVGWEVAVQGLMLRFYRGESFHSSLEGLPPWNLQAQFLGRLHRPTRASGGPALRHSPKCRRSPGEKGQHGSCCSLLASLGRPGAELGRSEGFLSGGRHAHPPAFAEATELWPTGFRALITLSRQSLYLYEFVLKKPTDDPPRGPLLPPQLDSLVFSESITLSLLILPVHKL